MPKRKARKAAKAIAAHAALAGAILRGELQKPCAWDALKLLYFGVKTDEACDRALERWAKKHGIVYKKRPVSIDAVGLRIRTYEVTFRRR